MRATLLAAAALAALPLSVLPAFADGAVSGSLSDTSFSISTGQFNLVGGPDGATAKSTGNGINNVNALAAQVVRLLMISLSLLCTVLMVAGGIVMATAGGNDDRVSKGKTMLTYSLVGLFVALSAYALIATVGWVLG